MEATINIIIILTQIQIIWISSSQLQQYSLYHD